MTSDIKSISIQKAEAAKMMFRDQSELAKEAIRKVRLSPEMLPNWKGNRRRRFDDSCFRYATIGASNYHGRSSCRAHPDSHHALYGSGQLRR